MGMLVSLIEQEPLFSRKDGMALSQNQRDSFKRTSR